MNPADLENEGAALERAKQEAEAELRRALLAGRCTIEARAKVAMAAASLDAHRAKIAELANNAEVKAEAERQAEVRVASAEIGQGAMTRMHLLLEGVAMPRPPKSLSISETQP